MTTPSVNNNSSVYSNLGLTTAGTTGTTASASPALDEQDFLQLMTAQLQTQDPLNPVSNADFFSQIAQFSTVSGISQLNSSFSSLSSQLSSSQSLQAAGLIGHGVLVPGSTTQLTSSGLYGAVEVPSSGPVTVQIRNSSGALVGTLDLGTQAAGTVPFTWDGKGADGKPAIADLHFKVEGPLAAQMEEVFLADYAFASGEEQPEVCARGEGGDHASRVLTEGPNEEIDRLVLVLIGALASAHERVWIMTPYFLPPAPLTSALQSAALRGVDVRIIIPERSDQPWMDWATRHTLRHLLQRQVRVHLRPPPFAHTKLILVDDWYVQFGSANLDSRSLRLNFELMVESYGRPLAREMAEHFAQVRSASREVRLEDLDERNLLARLRNALCWLFSPYL